jgi:phosphatidylserine/phosphatidylglycerophosphate/cardiolipin synthase-like enzyme
MTELLHALSDRDLQEAANALRTNRLIPPYSATGVQRVLSRDVSEGTANALNQLCERGFTPDQIAFSLELLHSDRQRRPRMEEMVDLVTTGPDVEGTGGRDTSVVVRELFANAQHSVLLAGYAVYQGQKVFQALADRMVAVPELRVRLFLDIQRPPGDTSAPFELIRRFAKRFKESQWPQDRPYPQVFFDPRSVETDPDQKSSLHAKTVIIDSRRVFISSANFSEAAQQRNIEVGVQLESSPFAAQLTQFFERLHAAGHFQPVTLI